MRAISGNDLAFISRLAAEEGLFYFFEHHESRHVMVFCDHNQGTSEFTNPLLYHHLAGGQRAQTCIFNFAQQQRVSPAQVQLKDYSFKQPSHDFLAVITDGRAQFN